MSATPLRGVAGVYRHIIDDVVTRVRTDFVQEGVDEAVLDELRELWESKLDDSGAIAAPPPVQAPQPGPAPQYYKPAHAPGYPGAAAAPAVDLSSFGKPEQYLQPTGFLPRPAVQQLAAGAYTAGPAPAGYAGGPAAGIHNVGQPGTYAAQLQARHLPPAAPQGAYAAPPSGGAAQVGTQQQQQVPPQHQQVLPQQPQPAQQHFAQQLAAQQLRPAQQQYTTAAPQPQQQYAPAVRPQAQLQQPVQQPQLQQPQVQQQQHPQFQQQQQSAAQPAANSAVPDARKRPFEGPDQGGPLSKQPYQQANGAAAVSATAAAVTIPQRDGNDDDEAGPSGGGGDDAFAGSDEGEDPLAGLSSDDDADGEDIPNVVLAQFEKVSRTKTRVGTKWKCQMKNGIMHLNGRDIIFHKGNGEMQF